MKIGILQPGYLPWLGFFEQMERTDLFILYDDVQYDKNGWRNRNRIKTPGGWQWLTVPVKVEYRNLPLIKEILIDDRASWQKKHLGTINQYYRDAPYFDQYYPELEKILRRRFRFLIDVDLELIAWLVNSLGLERRIILSSELDLPGRSTERLIRICRHFGADSFYEGASGRDYIDEALFRDAGIRLEYQDYQHPVYPQLYGEFVPYLSTVDLLFNCGAHSLEILKGKVDAGVVRQK